MLNKMLLNLLNSKYKEIRYNALEINACGTRSFYDPYDTLSEGRAVTARINWREDGGLKQYLQLHYGVMTKSDGTKLIVTFDKGVHYTIRGCTYVDVTIRRLNKSEALEASTWLESKLPKYNMLDIEPPFDVV